MSLQQKFLVSAIIRNFQGRILFLQRSQINKTFKGCWQLPEGKIELGESSEQALEREITEETSLSLKKSKEMLTSSVVISINNSKYQVTRLVFEAQCEGEIVLDSEHDQYEWLTKNEILAKDKKIDGLDSLIERLL